MHGAKRVVIFFLMIMVTPTFLIILPLYLRHHVFANVAYVVTESDIVEVVDGISNIFCESQTLKMNGSFNAFQLSDVPKINTTRRKHIRLKKSMTLPDDTFEYWGFHLLKGATVKLKLCSRYEGSRILVVRGERNLKTCHLLDRQMKKVGAQFDTEHKQVKITLEAKQEMPFNDSQSLLEPGDVGAEDENNTDVELFLKHKLSKYKKVNSSDEYKVENVSKRNSLQEIQQELYKLQQALRSNEKIDLLVRKTKRDLERHILDAKIQHGGNAMNYTDDEDSASSFEAELLFCYNGHILLTEGFPPSHLCTDVHYLENGEHLQTIHNVASDGYYHYIFYSDNDYISNDIHVVFDIYKPTFQYSNVSEEKKCMNQRECTFSVPFLSYQIVIVEVPTKDGIELGDEVFLLVSTCHPRMTVYMIFPMLIMILILGCAYL
ncbi:uncharacterized protein LOC108745054 isoform X2 [Agrilus planipennis]|nr:uncharacterized protein LOC108745054 isoform X2 [Agrilus planipennis]XP_018336605.1 uncharacterized protein LOC108745054 isoform X2 [Agrilus planipennis]XP_018336606.1 uncharacterized protein LOC108745054 isoform X2 [Agrilus planipennis]